ncbi:unnamed protein product [Symbiodinium sp. KB8]|nr:unnamed protein product [Symbiodinium sp. KB8]
MSGTPSGEGDGAREASGEAGGLAKAVQVLETLRAMRQLVTFCPDELPEAFANHFSRGQIAEMAARLEDARLAMEADDPPATQTRDPGSQRLWLAGGRTASPQRDLEYRALRATAWSEFSQEEVDAMSSLMKQSLTRRLARHEQDSAKAKARAEAEAIAKELARKKKAEHDARVAQAAMDSVKKESARKRQEALDAILQEEQLQLERFEKELEAAKKFSFGGEVDATDPTAASSSAVPAGGVASGAAGPSGVDATEPSQSKFPPLPSAHESAANKSGTGPEPSLSWSDIFAAANTYLRPL